MKPWFRFYRGQCWEFRFGALGIQGGMTLPHFSFVIWRNSDYAPVVGFRWGRWVA
jgi:hypothetical protein